MGEAYRKVSHLPALGKVLIESQKKDFDNCLKYYEKLRTNKDNFIGKKKSLVKYAHKIAFTTGLLLQKLPLIPQWALQYLNQLRSDTIQFIPSIVLGSRRSLHLYERASIEDALRYIYYFDHRIEHILLQNYPTKFQSFDSLIDWVKSYPSFVSHKEFVLESCNNLTSKYSELSRTVHGTTIVDLELSDGLKTLHEPIKHPVKEMNLMKSVSRSVIFLLSLFHLKEYRSFSLDEKAVISQHLTTKQKQVLSGIER